MRVLRGLYNFAVVTVPNRLVCLALAFLCGVMLCGCFPGSDAQWDEEKEPHFLKGRARVNAMDYRGAIESFLQALEVNPRSAAAHKELGWLYAEKESDPAAAIYHFERYLKLRPNPDEAARIQPHIIRLKQDLAKAVWPIPSTSTAQREIEQLVEENRQLREEVEKWRAYFSSRGISNVAAIAHAQAPSGVSVTPARTEVQPVRTVQNSAPVTPRTHVVASGESPSSIARKYGLRVDALLEANPGLNPRRLQIGQVITLPAR